MKGKLSVRDELNSILFVFTENGMTPVLKTHFPMSGQLTITIDGPAGSGKSSVARGVAALLGYSYLDSGAMYRALARKALERKVALSNESQLAALAKETHIELKPPTPECEAVGAKNRVFLDGKEVTREIRTAEVAQAASRLATIAAVRRSHGGARHRHRRFS